MSRSDQKPSAAANSASAVADLPSDELARFALMIGLILPPDAGPTEWARLVREHQVMLSELDREAMLDVMIWSRRPVRRSASKEELAREIAGIQRVNYGGLSRRGLAVLARFRGLPAAPEDDEETLIERLRKEDGLWKRVNARRRAWVGSILSRIVDGESDPGEYQFLPEDAPGAPARAGSLKKEIENRGVVGGLASRIRGAADDYIQQKLEEIDRRIDAKLEQIDQRLAEWRDREVANRLRILRITLMFTVLVALLSLGYNALKGRFTPPPGGTPPATAPSE